MWYFPLFIYFHSSVRVLKHYWLLYFATVYKQTSVRHIVALMRSKILVIALFAAAQVVACLRSVRCCLSQKATVPSHDNLIVQIAPFFKQSLRSRGWLTSPLSCCDTPSRPFHRAFSVPVVCVFCNTEKSASKKRCQFGRSKALTVSDDDCQQLTRRSSFKSSKTKCLTKFWHTFLRSADSSKSQQR